MSDRQTDRSVLFVISVNVWTKYLIDLFQISRTIVLISCMWFRNEFTFSIWFVACRLVREWWLWNGCNRIQQQTSYVRKMCVYLRWCYWQMSLTIQLDAAVRVTERILRDTLVRTEIRGCHSLDCQLHVHFVSVVQQNWLVFTTCTHTHRA